MPARSDFALVGAQGAILAAVLGAAVFAPRTGEPMALIPLAGQDARPALAWADAEGVPLVAWDPATARIIVAAPEPGGILRALAEGFLPVAAAGESCASKTDGGSGPWTN